MSKSPALPWVFLETMLGHGPSTTVFVNCTSSIHQLTPGSDSGAKGSQARRKRTRTSAPAKAPRLTTTWVMESVATVEEPPVQAGRPAIGLPKLPEIVPL